MKIKSPLVVAALVLAFGSITLPFQASAQTAAPAAANPLPTVITPELIKPLNEARDLINAKQFALAAEKLNTLNAVNKNPYEQFFIEKIRLVIASGTNDSAAVTKSVLTLLQSPYVTRDETQTYTDLLARKYYDEKKYDEAASWTQKSIALKDIPKSHELLGRIYYFSSNFAGAIKELRPVVDADIAANRTPDNDNLRLLRSSYQQTKDNAGNAYVLDKLVRFYPNKDYWGDLLYTVVQKPNFADRLYLDWFRLGYETDTIEEPSQVVDFAKLAQQAGFPAEAKRVLERGFANNILGTGKDAALHKQLLAQVTRQAADDVKTQEAGEASAKASKNGIGLTNVGFNYVLNGQAERGIALIEQGIAKGGLKSPEEAKLHLGIGYLKAGNKAKAAEIFATIPEKDGNSELAKLWLLVSK